MARHGQVAKQGISIHAPRTGSDSTTLQKIKTPLTFQSTLPARGATTAQRANHCRFSISIHAPRTGSDLMRVTNCCDTVISIHAPRTGSDREGVEQRRKEKEISIHAPRTGSDRKVNRVTFVILPISIHAPRTGSDPRTSTGYVRRDAFQSTLPARGATCPRYSFVPRFGHFNPRSPHGERHTYIIPLSFAFVFQSTLPARGATQRTRQASAVLMISIHAPRTGSDYVDEKTGQLATISIHAPRTGSDQTRRGN